MRGLGTIINVLAVMFLGVAGTLFKMLVVTDTETGGLSTNGIMLIIAALRTGINFFNVDT